MSSKCGSLIIQNRTDYLKEGYRQLSNTDSNRELDHNPTENFRTEIQNYIENMYENGDIEDSVRELLSDILCRTPNFTFYRKYIKVLNHHQAADLSSLPTGHQQKKIL